MNNEIIKASSANKIHGSLGLSLDLYHGHELFQIYLFNSFFFN